MGTEDQARNTGPGAGSCGVHSQTCAGCVGCQPNGCDSEGCFVWNTEERKCTGPAGGGGNHARRLLSRSGQGQVGRSKNEVRAASNCPSLEEEAETADKLQDQSTEG